MRELELLIDEALKNGLSPELRLPFNSQFLWECLGFRCGKAGLEAHILLDNPLSIALDMHYSWPFPQFITGENYNILVVRDTLAGADYVYSVSDDHLIVTLIATLTFAVYGLGSLMEVADFGEYIFMTNGVAMVYFNPVTLTWVTAAAIATIPMMKTVCNFNSQLIGGNVISAWHDCDETFYIWSKIASADFSPWLSNEAGYRRCPYGGEVYHVRKLGNAVVGYSSKGITLMTPVMEPVTGYRFTELVDIGVLNRGAVCAGLGRHIYVGEDYVLREVTSEGVKELGYQFYMQELANAEDIIITYDPSNKDYYIGNSTKTFLLSPYGLTEVLQHPSAMWRRDRMSYMLPDNDDTDLPYICTEVFDMQFKGQKTIFSIETDAMMVLGAEAGLDYSNDLLNWHSESYKPINDMGIVAIIAAGNMFRFRLRFDSLYNTFRIGYLKARYKMTDLRGIRGIYSPSPRGQYKGQ